jgi:hypothetical protein
MHRHLVVGFDDAAHGVDVGEIELRIDAAAEQVEGQCFQDTLPVRSPLPTASLYRSAPAARASSTDATAVPRSFSECTD